MEIKDLFEQAGGTLTYDKFVEACGNSKFVDLSDGNYVSVNKYNDEITKLKEQLETLNGTLKTRDKDLKELQTKLTDAGADADKLSTLSTDLTNLQKKYDIDTQKFKEQLKKQAYEFAVKEFANGYEFSSKAAKKEFIREMTNADLKMDDNGIIGGTDFYTRYLEENADSFVTTSSNNSNNGNSSMPQFSSSTNDNNNQPHKKSLSDMMKAKNNNPNMVLNFD